MAGQNHKEKAPDASPHNSVVFILPESWQMSECFSFFPILIVIVIEWRETDYDYD
jgi:hypothetical protein